MMSDKSKDLFKPRLAILIVLLVLAIIASATYAGVDYNSKIVKSNLTVYLDDDTEEIFEDQFNNKRKFKKYYTYTTSSDTKNSDFVFTSDFEQIDKTRDYNIKAYSPLVVCLKDTKNLNNYLTTSSEKGFLISSNKIKNSRYDEISCDFLCIIKTVLDGGNWSDLGGEDKEITIYCPEANTVSGDLFYDFLLITINNGKYPTDNLEEVKEKANLFLNSQHIIQTDVTSKISKLGGILQEDDIYVLFESDLLSTVGNADKEISIIYPDLTVIKELYLQYNNLDLQEPIDKAFDSTMSNYLSFVLYNTYDYRNFAYRKPSHDYLNIQEGFNYYELTD